MLLLWKFGRFDEAYKVAVDSVWLNPSNQSTIRSYLRDLRSHTPLAEALL
jgi:hypothetical protein